MTGRSPEDAKQEETRDLQVRTHIFSGDAVDSKPSKASLWSGGYLN